LEASPVTTTHPPVRAIFVTLEKVLSASMKTIPAAAPCGLGEPSESFPFSLLSLSFDSDSSPSSLSEEPSPPSSSSSAAAASSSSKARSLQNILPSEIGMA